MNGKLTSNGNAHTSLWPSTIVSVDPSGVSSCERFQLQITGLKGLT